MEIDRGRIVSMVIGKIFPRSGLEKIFLDKKSDPDKRIRPTRILVRSANWRIILINDFIFPNSPEAL